MQALVPITITQAMVGSSTCAEPAAGETAWSSATTYAAGVEVISATTHRRYQSLQATNLNHDPTLATTTTPTAWWADVGPTNKWAMFDGVTSTQTSVTSPLTVVLQPGFFNGLALFGLDADAISITVKDAPGGTVIYSYSGTLEGSHPGDWYEYWFSPFKPQTDFVFSGIAPYKTAELTVTLTGGTCKCGILAVGDVRSFGRTLAGAKAVPKSFSYISTDAYGNNTIVKRKKAKDMTASCLLELAEADAVHASLAELMDVPCLWIGTSLTDYAALRCYGLGTGEISFDHFRNCLLTVDVKGLI